MSHHVTGTMQTFKVLSSQHKIQTEAIVHKTFIDVYRRLKQLCTKTFIDAYRRLKQLCTKTFIDVYHRMKQLCTKQLLIRTVE